MPDMVNNPWGSMPIFPDQSIGEVFQNAGASLPVEGEPGAGKTIIDAYVKGQFQLAGKGSTRGEEPQKHKVTGFSETQMRKWLSWMAQNMQRHDKIDFLIEELEVSWLPGKPEKRAHQASSILVAWLIFVLIFVPIFGLSGRLSAGLIYGLIGTLIIGLIGALIFSINKNSNSITTSESTIWSWKNLTKNYKAGLKKGAIRGLIIGLIYGLIGALSGGLSGGLGALIGALIIGLIIGLIGTLIGGLIGIITSGWKKEIPQPSAIPNEGIKHTLRNSIKGFWVGALIFGPMGALSGGLNSGLIGGLEGALGYGLIGGLIGELWLGGLSVIRHYVLRFFIYLRGYGPWNYTKFLDYATDELQFMQRVGGGYLFIHPMLLEHFAVMEGKNTPENEDLERSSLPISS